MKHSQPTNGELHAWVSKSAPQALGYACTLVRNREAAEDLVQDCYCRLLAKANVYDLARDGAKLLYRSLTHACINWTGRQPRTTSLDHAYFSSSAIVGAVSAPAALEPIQMVIQRELEDAVEAAMNELAVEQRAAVELRSLGHSLVDVADMLGISHGNARVLLHRARTALAGRLTPYLEENPHDKSGR